MTPVVDVHTHLFPTSLLGFLRERSEAPRVFVAEGREMLEFAPATAAPFSPEMGDLGVKLARMQEAAISFGVLSVASARLDLLPGPDAESVARDVNDELVEIVDAHPDRLAAIALLPLGDASASAAELERGVRRGLKGALVESNIAGRPLDEAGLDPVFEAASGLGVPVFLHPNQPMSPDPVAAYHLVPVVGFLIDTTVATLRLILSGVFDRHPDLKLFLAHAGSLLPPIVGRVDAFHDLDRLPSGRTRPGVPPSEDIRRLYTDTVCVSAPALRAAVELFGPERVMFGTDAPYFAPEWAHRTLEASGFDAGARRDIGWANAQKLFGLDRVTE